MKIISTDIQNEIVIKKSKFITLLYRINNTNEAKEKLLKAKSKYNDASHICYAYICNQYVKFSDDKEPSGTAGKTIYSVLEKNNLNNILAIVIRYFGGIKLGIGGLSKAYRDSIINVIDLVNIKEEEKLLKITMHFNISNTKKIDYLLKNISIEKEFKNDVIYKFLINKKNYNIIEKELIINAIDIKKEII